jgi:tetratricopeptide (TPR) repeat protein
VGKKSRAKKGTTLAERPSGESEALVQFIRQLIQERRYDEAMRAAIALVENDPLNPLAHTILGSMLAQTDRPADAVRHYELAIRLGMTKDAELYRSLAVTSSLARLPMHALGAARTGSLLGPSPDQRELFESVISGSENYVRQMIGGRDIPVLKAERALLLIEGSSRAIQANELDRARMRAEEATLAAPSWPVTWNNLAMLQFGLDELPEAIATCERALIKVGADDAVLLSSLVRFHEVAGQSTEARAALERLQAIPAGDLATGAEIAKGYAVLGNDQQVLDLLSPFANTEGGLSTLARYLTGVAAANLGKGEGARAAWRNLAREGLTQVRAFTDMMARNEQPPTPGARYPYFSAAELVPGAVLESLFAEAQKEPGSAPIDEVAKRFPYLSLAICESLYAPMIDPRLAVEILLRLPNPEVIQAIERFAVSRLLGEYDRLYAHLALRGSELTSADAPASVWLRGRRRDLALPQLRLRQPQAPTYVEEIATLMHEAAEAQQRDDAAGAADYYRRALAQDPDLQEAEHNLGTALLLSNQLQEGEAHLLRSLELDDGYVLARCNLASLELSRGNVSEAHQLLDPLDTRTDYTLEEAVAYLRTRSDLAQADGDTDHAEILLHCILAYDHDNQLALERLAQSLRQTTGKAM